MSNKKDTVTRSFYYYDISLLKYKFKNLVRIDNQEANFYKIFNQIKNIQKEIKNGTTSSDKIEVNIDNGDKIYIIVDYIEKDKPIEFRLVLCRADALPLVENKGILNFLTDYLPKNFTLAAIVVVFPLPAPAITKE